ncbi:hypothetical protein I656_02911 [Geobacillus sp. WSUCF1]|nr:hypothetical protein I656_02911 [Geobacillus sp. WSUCF1]
MSAAYVDDALAFVEQAKSLEGVVCGCCNEAGGKRS